MMGTGLLVLTSNQPFIVIKSFFRDVLFLLLVGQSNLKVRFYNLLHLYQINNGNLHIYLYIIESLFELI